jgi:uncharacterized protein HemX
MGNVEKLKDKRKAERMTDPHAWADQMEREAGMRSVLPFLLLIGVLFLAANVWLLWQSRDDHKERLDIIEGYLHQTPRQEL